MVCVLEDEPKTDGKVIRMRTDNTELFKIVTSDQQKEKIGIFFEQEGALEMVAERYK